MSRGKLCWDISWRRGRFGGSVLMREMKDSPGTVERTSSDIERGTSNLIFLPPDKVRMSFQASPTSSFRPDWSLANERLRPRYESAV